MKRPFLPPEDGSPQIEGCYNFFFSPPEDNDSLSFG